MIDAGGREVPVGEMTSPAYNVQLKSLKTCFIVTFNVSLFILNNNVLLISCS